MAKFLFVHRVPQDYKLGEPKNVAAWEAWFESMGANRVDRGSAVIETSSLGNLGEVPGRCTVVAAGAATRRRPRPDALELGGGSGSPRCDPAMAPRA